MMDQKICDKTYVLLDSLKNKKVEYDIAYGEALVKKDFSGMEKLKEGLKDGIRELHEELYLKPLSELPSSVRAAVSKKNYDEAVETAREFDPEVNVPTRREILVMISKLGAEKLENIANVMGKPGVIIIPANRSVDEMITSMDMHRHYENQNVAHLSKFYQWSDGKMDVGVSIIDMQQYTKLIVGQKNDADEWQRDDEQLHICEKYFRERGMHLIHDYEYAVAMQRSLRAYKKAKEAGEDEPERYILDLFGQPMAITSILNHEHKKKIEDHIPHAFFSPSDRQVTFECSHPETKNSCYRGRGAVQVI